MQLLSLVELGPDAQRLVEDLNKVSPLDLGRAGVILGAVGLLTLILAAWIASQIVAKDTGTVGRAVKVILLLLISLIVIAVIAGVAFSIASRQNFTLMIQGSVVIGVILSLYAAVTIPMKTYRIRVGAALGFLLITLVVQSAAQLAVIRFGGPYLGLQNQLALGQRLAALPTDQQQKIVEELTKFKIAATGTSPTLVAPAGRTIEERQAELTKLYNELQERRAALQPGDQTALDAYTRDNDRYVQLLEQLQKDAAAPR